MNKIFWIAGENSGDIHTARVMKELNQKKINLHHFGIGGPLMQNEGLQPIFPFERFAVMGFAEVIEHLHFFWKVMRKIEKIFIHKSPDLVILTDYPGLNLRVAKLAKKNGIPVLYYICPQFWAWKVKRLEALKKFTDHIACILPFEKEYLDREEINSTYVGHPIAEELEIKISRQKFALHHSLDPKKQWISFFPGSRNIELKRILPILSDTTKYFSKEDHEIIFSCATSVDKKYFDKYIRDTRIIIIKKENHALMKHSDFLVVTSGTATLEAAYLGTPFVIIYKTGLISYLLGKKFIKIDMIGLPNIILKKRIIPELIQHQLNPKKLEKMIKSFLQKQEKYRSIKYELKKIHQILEKRSASKEVSEIILEMIDV